MALSVDMVTRVMVRLMQRVDGFIGRVICRLLGFITTLMTVLAR